MVNSVRLRPDTQVLLRPGGQIQFGVHPTRALVLDLPEGLSPGSVLAPLLADLRAGPEKKEHSLYDALLHAGLPRTTVTDLLHDLVDAGFARIGNDPGWPPSVLVIGKDGAVALRGAVAAAIRARGVRVADRVSGTRTSTQIEKMADPPDLVVLVGMEIPDVELLQQLRRLAIPFVGIRIRDGRGVLGPWCASGFESRCPCCVENQLAGDDPARGALAIQIQSTQAFAARPVVDATIAVLLSQLQTDGASLAGVEVEISLDRLTTVFHRIEPDATCQVCRVPVARQQRIRS